MQKRFFFLTSLSVFMLILSACSSGGSQNSGAQGTGAPGAYGTGTAVIPQTGQTAQATSLSTQTSGTAQPLATTPAAGSATVVPSAAAGTMTVPASGMTTETQAPAGSGKETSQAPAGQSGGTGVIGIPGTGNGQVAGLASMIGFRVVDTQGKELGTVQDYVVNTCEAHILYMVVQPGAGASAGDHPAVLIPYEAAALDKLNKGRIDASQKTFTINMDSATLTGAPAVDLKTVNFETPNWDSNLMAYWKSKFRLSLTSGCSVPLHGNPAGSTTATLQPNATAAATAMPTTTTAQPVVTGTVAAGNSATGTPAVGTAGRQTIQRLALASKLLNANLQDGTGRAIGSVRDIAIIPASGRTQFLLIQPEQGGQAGSGMVALPPGAVNIKYTDTAGQLVLVLLVDPGVFQSAPAFDQKAGPFDQKWFDYWKQFVPMTKEQMP